MTRRFDKIQTHIHCDIALDVGTGATYDLMSVVEHDGVIGGGHYVAYAHSGDGNLYYFNDGATPAPISIDDVLARPLYMLLYSQRQLPQS